MLLDHRVYTCRAGTLAKQLALYAEHGYAVQQKHLGKPLMYASTDVGNVNQYVHVWVYADAADRERRRAAMKADPDWIAYLKRSGEAGYLESQSNSLLYSVDFEEYVRPA